MFRRIVAVTALCLLALPASAASAAQTADLNRRINSLVELLSDGPAVGYPRFRHIHFGDIYSADRDDAVVLFSMEGFYGGNTYYQYLAVFEAVSGEQVNGRALHPYRLVAVSRVGGSGWRALDPKSMVVGKNSIRLSGKKWGPSDANCCPSQPITASFHTSEHEVIEEPK